MDVQELNKFGKFLYEDLFKEEFTIPIKINNRLKRVHAWFVPSGEPYIEVSKHLSQQDIHIIADILGHEFTHYYLYKHNKPYQDEDFEFYALTYQKGISRTQTASVVDGIMKYIYCKHESRGDCGFKIESYFPVVDNDFRPIIICPKCNKNLKYYAIGNEYKDYIPSFANRMRCEWYIEHKGESRR